MIAAIKQGPASARRQSDLAMLAIHVCEDAACVTDHGGRRLYSSPALERLLAEETERVQLQRAIDDVRNGLVARAGIRGPAAHLTNALAGESEGVGGASIVLQTRTSQMEYRLHATAVTDTTRHPREQLYVIWIRRCKPHLLTAEILSERFGLTPREIRVSTLVAARLRSREIAAVLGISIHTARRHAEAVLRKVGVSSRTELRDRLRIEGPA
jgi:DNA-binding CsgD family transcriptional regulator